MLLSSTIVPAATAVATIATTSVAGLCLPLAITSVAAITMSSMAITAIARLSISLPLAVASIAVSAIASMAVTTIASLSRPLAVVVAKAMSIGGGVGERAAIGGVGKAGGVAEAVDRGGGESVSGESVSGESMSGESVSGVGDGSGVAGGSNGARGAGNDNTSLSLPLAIASVASIAMSAIAVTTIAGLCLPLAIASIAAIAMSAVASTAVTTIASLSSGNSHEGSEDLK